MPEINIDAHYTDNMKVPKPVVEPQYAPANIIKNTKTFSYKDADVKMKNLNNDIYEGARKERSEHGFNKNLFFKIFGGITLLTVIGTILHHRKK